MPTHSLSSMLTQLVWLSLQPLLMLAVGLAGWHAHAERRLGNYAAQIDNFLEARILALKVLTDSPLADDPARWPDFYTEAQAFQNSFGTHVIFTDTERQMRFNTRVPFVTAMPKLPDARQGRSVAPVALETGKPTGGDIVQGPVINEQLVTIAVSGLLTGAT